jgi:hypothetical protein
MRLPLVVLLVLVVAFGGIWLACTPAMGQEPEGRRILPDYSEGLTGLLGPFVWSRAMDIGGDARFCDGDGRPDPDGEFLWLYQFMRYVRAKPEMPLVHERSNLVSLDADLAYDLQPWRLLLHCRRPHNFKFVVGYVQDTCRFEHGDNTDLAHLAAGDRVCLFLPVRHDTWREGERSTEQSEYYVNPVREAQGPCVIEFGAREMIHYEWFAREPLDPHVLLDLTDVLGGADKCRPTVERPIFRFELGEGKGAWALRIERDGRDGLAGGERDGDWDLSFTHESPGAKPYTVNVTRGNSVWAMSTFSPGGLPEDSSEAVVKLLPFNRDTGERASFPARRRRVRTFAVDKLQEVLEGGRPKLQRPVDRLRRLGREDQ